MKQYVIGIDGGGTSTEAAIMDTEGNIIAEARSGPTNPNTTREEHLRAHFTEIYIELKKQTETAIFNNVIHIFAGISGGEHAKAKEILYNLLKEIIDLDAPITIDNDAITALYAGTIGEPGVVQIGGTGSITFGVDQTGQRLRVGGWGHFIYEKSSGYYIGKRALEYAFRTYDKGEKETLLVEKLKGHFQVEMLPEIVHDIYHAQNPKEIIASFAKKVFDLFEENDQHAQAIIKEIGNNIGEEITILINRLFTNKEAVNVVFVGSIFKRMKQLKPFIEEVFEKNGLQIKMITQIKPPVFGACVAGLLQEGIRIENSE